MHITVFLLLYTFPRFPSDLPPFLPLPSSPPLPSSFLHSPPLLPSPSPPLLPPSSLPVSRGSAQASFLPLGLYTFSITYTESREALASIPKDMKTVRELPLLLLLMQLPLPLLLLSMLLLCSCVCVSFLLWAYLPLISALRLPVHLVSSFTYCHFLYYSNLVSLMQWIVLHCCRQSFFTSPTQCVTWPLPSLNFVSTSTSNSQLCILTLPFILLPPSSLLSLFSPSIHHSSVMTTYIPILNQSLYYSNRTHSARHLSVYS